jgi:cob(I)alamin adenosyltransferase
MTKYYSRKGDKGTTGLLSNNRVPKSHLRICAVGAIDEASAALGMARAVVDDPKIKEIIQSIQLDLYKLMSQIVLEEPNPDKFPDLPPDRVIWLEEIIQKYQDSSEDPQGFILPGGTQTSAALGVARTIIRRAERECVNLDQSGMLVSQVCLPYLNRLSSLCFVLELHTSDQITPITDKKP